MDSAQAEKRIAEPVGQLGEPLGIDPGLAGHSERVGLNMNEVVRGGQDAGVGQVPPDVGVFDELGRQQNRIAEPDGQADEQRDVQEILTEELTEDTGSRDGA